MPRARSRRLGLCRVRSPAQEVCSAQLCHDAPRGSFVLSTELGAGECRICAGVLRTDVPAAPDVVVCVDCGVGFRREFPSDSERRAYYQDQFHSAEDAARFLTPIEPLLRAFRWLRARSVLRHEPGPASLLDVGCSRGVLIAGLQRRGWRVAGTQLSQTAADAARRRGLGVVVGELPELGLAAGSFRVVTFFHVLEHLVSPARYLRSAHDLLEPNGLLVVEVPNYASWGFRVLGQRCLCFDHPHHLFFFTPQAMSDLLARCGFDVLSISRYSFEYSLPTTLQNLLNLLPGRPNRLLESLKNNHKAKELRRQWTSWLHLVFGVVALPVAVVWSLVEPVIGGGNTFRVVARRRPPLHPTVA